MSAEEMWYYVPRGCNKLVGFLIKLCNVIPPLRKKVLNRTLPFLLRF